MPEVLVLGAGPGGLAAAAAAAEAGASVRLVEGMPFLGGQIWRGATLTTPGAPGRAIRALGAGIHLDLGTRALAFPAPGQVLLEGPEGPFSASYDSLILATGARERVLPFPGWTLPGVTGAGGLQALAKAGFPVAGRRVLVAGTGPLLLAVAAFLRARGAKVLGVLEQAPLPRLLAFGTQLLRWPTKALQGLALGGKLLGIPYRPGTWVVEARGEDRLREVRLSEVRLSDGRTLEVDLLACGFGLAPNLEVAQALGCDCSGDRIQVDGLQRTSRPRVLAVGEGTGIGGASKAWAEGRVAGRLAAGEVAGARRAARAARRESALVKVLERAFALHPELAGLPRPDTVVCRCEGATLGQLSEFTEGREARLHTRCGMGPCQGRTCGPATRFLLGWEPSRPQMPLHPTSFATFLAQGTASGRSSD